MSDPRPRITGAAASGWTTLLTWVLALATPGLAEQADFAVGPLEAAPGERVSGFLPVVGADGIALPITLINGARPGPTLTLVAGTHGAEYAPILALHRVRRAVAPAELNGRLILVHVANVPAFFGRAVYYSPADGKNLNRVYPGDAAGTLSERIAYTITREILGQTGYLVDMHAGDGNEALAPYVYLHVTGDPGLDDTMENMALAFGIDTITLLTLEGVDRAAPGYTDSYAVLQGIPTITTETGCRGETGEHWVAMAERGVLSLLRALAMLPGEPIVPGDVTWLSGAEVLRADVAGVFEARVEAGTSVAEGALIGELHDLFGEPLAQIRAPFAGWVNYVVATPPVSPGEPLAMISRVVRR